MSGSQPNGAFSLTPLTLVRQDFVSCSTQDGIGLRSPQTPYVLPRFSAPDYGSKSLAVKHVMTFVRLASHPQWCCCDKRSSSVWHFGELLEDLWLMPNKVWKSIFILCKITNFLQSGILWHLFQPRTFGGRRDGTASMPCPTPMRGFRPIVSCASFGSSTPATNRFLWCPTSYRWSEIFPFPCVGTSPKWSRRDSNPHSSICH